MNKDGRVYCRITDRAGRPSSSAALTPERAWELYNQGFIVTPWRTA